jgi:hypothetical protein
MHLRSVAGVFVLSAGLFVGIGGGAIAAADTDSASGTQAAEGANQGAGAAGVSTTTTDTQPTAASDPDQNDVTAAGSTSVPSPGEAGVTTGTTVAANEDELAKQVTESDTTGSNAYAADATSTTTASTPPTSPAAAEPAVVASDSNPLASTTNVPAAESTVATSNSNVVAAESGSVSPLASVLQPMANAVNNVINSAQTIPAQAAALSTTPTPVADVIASVQKMLTTVAGVVGPLVQLPSDLYALLNVPRTVAPGLIGQGGAAAFPVDNAAPLFGPQASQAPVTAGPVSLDGSLFGTLISPASLGAITTSAATLAQQLSLSGMAQLAPEGIRPATARSLLQHVVTAVLVPASLTALAALALPGIAGLLVVCAAGIRVGYRQAKAGWALRVSGIARFAGSGPMGVVRSGSLISLHTRTPRVKRLARPEMTPAAVTPAPVRHLERVA